MNFQDILNAVMIFDKFNLVENKLQAVKILGLMLDKALAQLTVETTTNEKTDKV